jgi:hypothetical protein
VRSSHRTTFAGKQRRAFDIGPGQKHPASPEQTSPPIDFSLTGRFPRPPHRTLVRDAAENARGVWTPDPRAKSRIARSSSLQRGERNAMQLKTRTSRGRPIESQPRRKDDVPPTYPKGRVCAASRVCNGAFLSIYHAGPDCYQCSPQGFPSVESVEELDRLMAQMPR